MMIGRYSLYARNYLSQKSYKLFSTVSQNTIHITFVDQDGNRANLPALIGQTLKEAAESNNVIIPGGCGGGGMPTNIKHTEDWNEIVYGEGPSCFWCHVKIPSKYNDILPLQTEKETGGLEEVWEEEFSATSRLACLIKLDKRHDGMVVLVPDSPPTDIV